MKRSPAYSEIRGIPLLVLMIVLTGCQVFRSMGEPEVDEDFYHDRMDVEALIREEDAPKRKASMRMIAQALQKAKPESDDANARRALIADLERALQLDPYNPYAYYFLGLVQIQDDQFGKAESAARKSRQLFKKEETVWLAKALVLEARATQGLKQTEKAQALYLEAEKLDPLNPLIQQGRSQM